MTSHLWSHKEPDQGLADFQRCEIRHADNRNVKERLFLLHRGTGNKWTLKISMKGSYLSASLKHQTWGAGLAHWGEQATTLRIAKSGRPVFESEITCRMSSSLSLPPLSCHSSLFLFNKARKGQKQTNNNKKKPKKQQIFKILEKKTKKQLNKMQNRHSWSHRSRTQVFYSMNKTHGLDHKPHISHCTWMYTKDSFLAPLIYQPDSKLQGHPSAKWFLIHSKGQKSLSWPFSVM